MSTGEKLIEQISAGGPIKGGALIAFDLLLEDGQIEHLQCMCEKLPKVIHALKQFGEMAEHVRQNTPGPAAEVVSPYRAAAVKVGRNSDGSVVVLQVRTEEGIPLLVSMSLDLAMGVADAIFRSLDPASRQVDRRS